MSQDPLAADFAAGMSRVRALIDKVLDPQHTGEEAGTPIIIVKASERDQKRHEREFLLIANRLRSQHTSAVSRMRNEFEAGRKSLMRGPNVPKGRPGRSMGPKTFDM